MQDVFIAERAEIAGSRAATMPFGCQSAVFTRRRLPAVITERGPFRSRRRCSCIARHPPLTAERASRGASIAIVAA